MISKNFSPLKKSLSSAYSLQLSELRNSIKRERVDGFLVTDINNVRYLTSFSGSSGILLFTKDEAFLITDFRYKEQAKIEVTGWDIIAGKGDTTKTIKSISKKTSINKLGFESSVTYDFFRKLSKTGISLKALSGLIEKQREIKKALEINLIREAVRRAESAFLEVKPYLKQGIREKSIAMRLEERLKKKGCRRIPFDVIVASGQNSAMPHARPTEKKLNKGDFVIIDWGGEAGGYFSDITRTMLIKGNNINKKKEIYKIILKANKKAISQVLPGIKLRDIDLYAREVIQKEGYGEFFGHATGHGVGLQVHESPRIAWNNNKKIKEDMVFTVEPGIYIPGLGGVRIEDMVAVKPDGPDIMTTLPKELDII
ncbi:MAG: hypothetical protein A2Y97_12095 [Nitrospirae bacterium RBG_13_39_12]|nr:MAG: hypothetical protein A2Y97_12095 [Nitrospirae bacterium RBG_13_39_12]